MKTYTPPTRARLNHSDQARAELTPFDRLMIAEAFHRCYGLRDAVRFDVPDSAQMLAHQTGFRLRFLLDNWEEVKGV